MRHSLLKFMDLGRELNPVEQTDVHRLDDFMLTTKAEKEHLLRIGFDNKLLPLSWLLQPYVYGQSQILSHDRHRHTCLKISKHCISATSLHHQELFSNLPFRPLPNEFQAAFFEQTSCTVHFSSSLVHFSYFLLEECTQNNTRCLCCQF